MGQQYSQHPDFNQPVVDPRTVDEFQGFSTADYPAMIPFNFSTFLLPDAKPTRNEWFSNDFYSAMHETGNEWLNFPELESPPQAVPPLDTGGFDNAEQLKSSAEVHPTQQLSTSHEEGPSEAAGITRVTSPPNIPSEDDKWLFMYNPKSTPALSAYPISIPPTHPLFLSHDPRYDISDLTYLKLRNFLASQYYEELARDLKGKFTLPDIEIVNLFIGLYFKHFAPQFPVLHLPTVKMDELPPPLIACMMIIGAMYSHVKRTRRFAIVLQDSIGCVKFLYPYIHLKRWALENIEWSP